MGETLKYTLANEFEKLKSEIDSKGKTVIDISTKFQELFSANIIQITLGEDISNDLIEIKIRGPQGAFENAKVKFVAAIDECTE